MKPDWYGESASSEPVLYEGKDETGSVAVSIGRDLRVESVRLEDGWERVLDYRTLGPAVLAARRAADMWYIVAQMEAGEPTDDVAPAVTEKGRGSRREVASELSTQEKIFILNDYERERRAFEARLQEELTTDRRLTSPGGVVTATVRGAEITGFSFDKQALPFVNTQQLESQLLGLYQSVFGRSDEVVARLYEEFPAVGRLMALGI